MPVYASFLNLFKGLDLVLMYNFTYAGIPKGVAKANETLHSRLEADCSIFIKKKLSLIVTPTGCYPIAYNIKPSSLVVSYQIEGRNCEV